MWGSAATEPPGGGFGRGVPPPAENFAILGTENHVLMHFRTTFWGYNVDYLLCLVTLQLNINNKKKKKKKKKKIFKNVKIRGSAEKSHACQWREMDIQITEFKSHLFNFVHFKEMLAYIICLFYLQTIIHVHVC